jgi:hypothetical protein
MKKLKEGRGKETMMEEEKRKKDLRNKRRSKHWTSFLNPKHYTGVPSLLYLAYLLQDTLPHCFQRHD